jgi:nucleotide-binding universal stress UspA family protein
MKGMTMDIDLKRILVPVDFSTNSAWALDYAVALARKFDAALHLVHVCEVPSMLTGSMDAYAIAYTNWSQLLGAEAECQLEKFRPRLEGITVTTEVLFGNPARAVVTAAGTNAADLIVMGTHGHGPVMHVVMGNVAERVVRASPCPVLTVREPRQEPEAKSAPTMAATALLAALVLLPVGATTASAQSQTVIRQGDWCINARLVAPCDAAFSGTLLNR